MTKYGFDEGDTCRVIRSHFLKFMKDLGMSRVVVGISGGKDSTVVAKLAADFLGPCNVWGVSIPNDIDKDSYYTDRVFNYTGIHRVDVNIKDSVNSILSGIENNYLDSYEKTKLEISDDTKINLPCRLRTATLYAVAQSIGAIVLNTSNLTEDILGYATLWGDTCGSYAMIQGLTVTEVIKLGEFLGIPDELIHKVPTDGLQDLTDEVKLGMKYADVDKMIRENEYTPDLYRHVMQLFQKNRFKIDMVKLPGPKFRDLPNLVFQNSIIGV